MELKLNGLGTELAQELELEGVKAKVLGILDRIPRQRRRMLLVRLIAEEASGPDEATQPPPPPPPVKPRVVKTERTVTMPPPATTFVQRTFDTIAAHPEYKTPQIALEVYGQDNDKTRNRIRSIITTLKSQKKLRSKRRGHWEAAA